EGEERSRRTGAGSGRGMGTEKTAPHPQPLSPQGRGEKSFRRTRAGMPMRRQQPARRRPMRVLIADDDRIVRHLLQRTLEQWGYEVTAVANGEDAWGAFATRDFPVVITDWEMPGLTGVELVQRIRAQELPGYV